MRNLIPGAVPSLVLLLTACVRVPSLNPIAQAGADVLGASVGIQRASATAESAAVNLRRGLEGIDPAGIKELLATDGKLRAELDSVQRIYLQGMGAGVVDITGRDVQVRVTHSVGELLVNAWIDTPANQFWSGRITDRNVRLPVDLEAFLRDYTARRCQGQSGGAAASCAMTAQRVMPTAADVYVQEVFQRYLRTAIAPPAPDLPPSLANPRFGGSGEHKIFFQVVPMKPDENGNWAARLEIWLVDNHGNQANVFAYDVDNQRYPGQQMEDPLKPIVASLVIRTATAK